MILFSFQLLVIIFILRERESGIGISHTARARRFPRDHRTHAVLFWNAARANVSPHNVLLLWYPKKRDRRLSSLYCYSNDVLTPEEITRILIL